MLHHSQFTTSKYHNPKRNYGSLSQHKRHANKRMNTLLKHKLIEKGQEKLHQLCDRVMNPNPPKQFIKPATVVCTKKQLKRLKYWQRRHGGY